ncbi:DNA topoisomerase [Rhodotorula toruloides]
MPAKWLCVAEKPSVAKSIAQILSGGQFTTRTARKPQWIKNYSFSYRQGHQGAHSDFTVTSVAGHLTSSDFDDQYRKWHSCDPRDLFDAGIRTFVTQDADHKGIESNLLAEARNATHLMIWTDCDREGEYIGSVVAEVCRKAKPNIVVKRARFSAIIPAQINQAARNPVDLDLLQAAAVGARMELDLRVGSIFTRVQTLELQRQIGALEDSLISYGPCQFPTLGFVVDQYERVSSFVPEPFWYIHVALAREDSKTTFVWRRGRLYDRDVAQALLDIVEDAGEARVTKWETKPTQKWKPLPLTTVELQKSGSRLLRMPPKRVLEIAESLYHKGILSYPRTETDQFDRDFNFHELITQHKGDNAWGTFATNLLDNGGFERPRNGKKNDKAHPPIHPTQHVNNLTGDDKRVYDLVARRFLGCCSKNAKGLETTCEIEIAGEAFSAKGLVIRERNYLDVYIYDKWTGNHLPEFQVGERFEPDELSLKEGMTTQPSLLTEADLVSLMDKNGIGTDATIAEHISKIIDREYVIKQKEGSVEYLVPSTLGIGLVKAYDALGLENSLSKPHLRRLTEERLVQICEGKKNKADVITQSLNEYREVLFRTQQQMAAFVATVRQYVEGNLGQVQGGGNGGGGGGGGHDGGGGGGWGRNDSDGDDFDGGGGGGGARKRTTQKKPAAKKTAAKTAAGSRGKAASAGKTGAKSTATKRKKKEEEDEDFAFDDAADQDIPSCGCSIPAVERTVTKEGPNKGRKFFGCSKGMSESCGFFAWTDEEGSGGSSGRKSGGGAVVPQKRPLANGSNRQPTRKSAASDELRCDCDLTPQRLTVKAEGPNQGREFLKCPNVSKNAQCKFFTWVDSLDGDAGPAPMRERSNSMQGSGGGVGGASGTCFQCGEAGHWASDCPQAGKAAKTTRKSGGSASGGASGECYICHEEGHWASACPQRGQGGSSCASGGGGGSNYSCYKCGEQGHFSNACPNADSTGTSASRGRGRGRGSRGGGKARGRGRGGKRTVSNDWD